MIIILGSFIAIYSRIIVEKISGNKNEQIAENIEEINVISKKIKQERDDIIAKIRINKFVEK